MNAVTTRQRRWSSRLNNMANNSSTASTNSSPANGTSLLNSNQMHCNNYTQYETKIYEAPGVVLRPLPFYDMIEELIRPAGLISDGIISRVHDSRVEFTLTIEQADMIAMSLNSKQILLRFCYLDDKSEQDDNFPPEVGVSVNGACVQLPTAVNNPNKPNIPPKRPGQHLDITKLCKICPLLQNSIDIKWCVDTLDPSRSYAVTVIIAERVEAETLLERVKGRGLSDPEQTRKLIVDSDNEVATMKLQSSLNCPVGKMRMSMPCKSVTCQHIPCFDALFYLQMNEKKASWTCPVCYKPAFYQDLLIDGFFMDILSRAETSVTEVKLNTDGSWTPVVKMEQPTAKNPPPEVITIDDDDD